MKLPLKDGDEFIDNRGRRQIVGGSVTEGFFTKELNHSVCWTRRGDWFRRSDGVEVTGAYRDENGNPVTVAEAYKLRAQSRYT
jgi:hypothetical protein